MALKVKQPKECEVRTEDIMSNLLSSNIKSLSSSCYLRKFSNLDNDCILMTKYTIETSCLSTISSESQEVRQVPTY